jgi:hypothetical protein
MEKYVHVKIQPPSEDEKQDQAVKITRLRALRLAKETADRDSASREAAASAGSAGRDRAPPTR